LSFDAAVSRLIPLSFSYFEYISVSTTSFTIRW